MQASSTSPVIVGLMEISTGGINYLPYATGLLQTYAIAHAQDPERYRFLMAQFQRVEIATAVEKLALAQIVGFSVYAWNINYNLEVAKALKARNPQTLIVFGGPQVPDEPSAFLDNFPFIDVVCHGEGEVTFLQLLEAYPTKDWKNIAGISYPGPDQRCITHPRATRIKDLDRIPSPYLSGVFEPLMASHPDTCWAAVWETNRGCPFSCTFCDWGSAIASKLNRFGEERLNQEAHWFGHKQIVSIFCSDSNFGILPRDLGLAQRLAEVRKSTNFPRKIVTAMTKNQPERAFDAHKILWDAGLLTSATLSLQTVTPHVLAAIERSNISLETYHQLLKRFVASGIPTYTDILLGLPGETFDSFLDVLSTVISQGQYSEMRVWYVQLLPNAPMSAPGYRQKYGIESVMIPYHTIADLASGQVNGVQETCEMVIATNTMTRQDWLRMQALAWMVQMLYYGSLMQLPLLLVQALSGLSHRELILAFFEDPLPQDAFVMHFIRQFLLTKALELCQGLSEYDETQDPRTGRVMWAKPPDFCMAQVVLNQQLGAFYQEAEKIIAALLQRRGIELPPKLLTQSLRLMKRLTERRFVQEPDPNFDQSYNLLECYQQILKGLPFQLKHNGRLYQNPIAAETKS